MTVFRRYFLLQIPGWIITAIILSALHHWMRLPAWIAVLLYAGYVIKDFLLFPFLRRAYETDHRSATEMLIGETGVATQPLGPEGYVRLRGELWHAEIEPGAAAIPEGTFVTVQAVRGMSLIVAARQESLQ